MGTKCLTKKQLAKKERNKAKEELESWAIAGKERDGFACCVCGRATHIQSHHILSKFGYKQYKLDPLNNITLCVTHHMWGQQSAHQNSIWFAEWLRKNKPDQYKWAMERL